MATDDYLRAAVAARRAQLRSVARPRTGCPRRWRTGVDRLHLRLWWATRPRTRRLHCLVTADDGLSVLGDRRPAAEGFALR
ncbi:hypothetical protein EV383_3327 [Pseudonocardia sediminis]|uniref:Uncharacterized protein n=1 Tax=Pseudonocardia sediminis TaxID=1397368 RepID=A0A4Q7UWT1_PSEST|nr:hypothetical protein [Pseudonocardia sediminis]RZT86432.1 hypothetical protein EV383_3327 [Pseudonocardia sediminis]